MKEKLVIWGAGRNGYIAYYAYKDKYDISFYVDTDENKWGTFLNGIPVKKTDELKHNKILVLIALRWGRDVVKRRLIEEYGIQNFIIFSINEDYIKVDSEKNTEDKNLLIMMFGGGLGNQMFQYALYRRLETMGKNVCADLSLYNHSNTVNFEITNVFSKARVEECSSDKKNELIKKNTTDFFKPVNFTVYSEPSIYDENEKKADMNLLHIFSGIINGMFQTREYAQQIRDELIHIFTFPEKMEEKLCSLSKEFQQLKIIGVHIRRGDYLDEANRRFYENICTDSYYKNAIEWMLKENGNAVLSFFSDDIEWVKEHYKMKDALYIEEEMFDHYQNWYDMYLMSLCKHNIIANSTFSWWGAWLNQNPDKVVIAPKKWVNQCKHVDIYPVEWIQM